MTDRTISTTTSDRTGAGANGEHTHYLVVALEASRPPASGRVMPLPPGSALTLLRGERSAADVLAIPDGRMSSPHAELFSDRGTCILRDLDSKNGTFVNNERVSRRTLRDGDVIEVGSTFLVFRSAPTLPRDHEVMPFALRTLEPTLQTRFAELARVACSNRSVLIRGDTGTGKELTARAVHEFSARTGAFVGVNCGALTESLIEAELFGVRRGAYSGADAERIGLVRSADGGTLFLDEIAELSESSQVALLRVLQESEVRPVGASTSVRVDVRFVAATHQDLEQRTQDGRFRRDLYARLSGHVISLPPLSERREDIGLLTAQIISAAMVDGTTELRLRRTAGRGLMLYDWPLNIRELDNALRAALLLIDDETITLDHLPEPIRRYLRTADAPKPEVTRKLNMGEPDELRRQLERLYRRHGGNVSAVARELGKARSQVQRWNRQLGIDPAAFES